MGTTRSHIVTGAVAVAVAVAAGVGINTYAERPTAAPTRVVEQRIQTTGKYAWGDLSDAEQAKIVEMLGAKLKGKKVEIFCGGSWCHDLAQDLDEVMDKAGAVSKTDIPFMALGAGLGISPSTPETKVIVAALANATAARLIPTVIDQATRDGTIVIAIGDKPRH